MPLIHSFTVETLQKDQGSVFVELPEGLWSAMILAPLTSNHVLHNIVVASSIYIAFGFTLTAQLTLVYNLAVIMRGNLPRLMGAEL